MSNPNAIWDFLKDRMDSGQLIADNITESLFHTYMYTVLEWSKHMLLDGYPRSLHQVEDMFRIFDKHKRTPIGIFYDVPDEVVLERMLIRWREDDTKEVIKFRIEQFYNKTMPVVDFFKKHAPMLHVNANDTIQNIHENTVETVEENI